MNMSCLRMNVLGFLVVSALLGACTQSTVQDACLNQWNLCIADTSMAALLTEAEFIESCEAAAQGENESGTVASDDEIACVANATLCTEINACVE